MYIKAVSLDHEGLIIIDYSGLTIVLPAHDALELLRHLKLLEGALYDQLHREQKVNKVGGERHAHVQPTRYPEAAFLQEQTPTRTTH